MIISQSYLRATYKGVSDLTIKAGMLFADRFRIETLVGSGGMAHVYKAYDQKANRTVAIKVLKEEYTENAEFVRRFRSEAQAVLQLSNENIVKYYDVGQYEGTHYLVLEFVEGKTLKQLIRERGALPVDETIRIALQLCNALEHAHAKGLIHRDVKPQNIIINDKGLVKVADFGIARFVDATTVTYMGTNVLGSVHYVSPEQARGEMVDKKTDIYSLGVVLYEMMTGKLPFDSENTVSVAIKHIQEQMKPPIQIRPEIGQALNDIVMKATQKRKELRYKDLHEMKRDLSRAQKDPNGKFVVFTSSADGQNVRGTNKMRKRKMARGGIGNIAIITLLIIGVLLSVVIIGQRALFGAETAVVPRVIGELPEDASERLQELGFELVIRNEVVTDEQPPGYIFTQIPESGSKAKVGDKIYVDISLGDQVVSISNYVGMLLAEARIEAERQGVKLEINYEYSDYEEGTIFNQLPEAGTEVEYGDTIQIWISGEGTVLESVPSLTNISQQEAIQLAQSSGFRRIIVTYIESDEVRNGYVVNQLPTAGEAVSKQESIQLWIANPESFAYTAEEAVNIDVPVQDSKVKLIADFGTYQVVLADVVMPAGKQTIPVTIGADTPGECIVRVYIDGQLLEKERTVTLK